MRLIKRITAEEENFRVECQHIRRDSVEPEPIGTIVLIPHRVIGYDKDCDGSLIARLEVIFLDELPLDEIDSDKSGQVSTCRGLNPEVGIVMSESELKELYDAEHKP